MAPGEASSSESTTIKANSPQSLTPSPSSEERPVLHGVFREQYHKLHRSKSLTNNNVENLRSRFEKQDEPDERQGPKPKIQLVNKNDLFRKVEGVKKEVRDFQKDKEIPEVSQGPKPEIPLDNKVEIVKKEDIPKDNGLKESQQPTIQQDLIVNVEVHGTIQKENKPPIPKKRQGIVLFPVSEDKTGPEKDKILKKSSSVDGASPKETRKQKRVSFSFETNNDPPPVPKPRFSVPIQQVIVETTVIKPEKIEKVQTVILPEPLSPSDLDKIEFADPEDRHHVTRHNDFAVGSVENIQKALNNFTMDTKKKRSPSFRAKLMTIFTKDKDKKPKEKEENKKTKKTENAVFADNAQNENFNRHSTQRRTIDTPRREPKPMPNLQLQNHQQSFHNAMHPDQTHLEQRYAAMHIQNYQEARKNFEAAQQQHIQLQSHQPLGKVSQGHAAYNPNDDYVCMDTKNDAKNYMNVPNKYDSSSTNTIESENSTTSVNPLQQLHQERLAIRSKFFNETGTPPRAQDTNQHVQLVNPKAAIPINSERPLPNPYQQSQPLPQARNGSPYHMQPLHHQLGLPDENDLADSGYGTVYDRNSRPMSAGSSDVSGGSMSSPRSPSVERTKLRLPPNRERMDLQPRIKSPIPSSEVSTDKLIATELLKTNKKNDKKDKDRSSPSHQKLQLEIDYPDLHETICDVVDQATVTPAGNTANPNYPPNPNELSITSFHKNDVSSSSFNVTDNNVHVHNVSGITNGNVSNVTMNDMEVSREVLMEAGDWHRVQRDLASSPSLKNVQITTNALVHVDSPIRATTPSQDGRSRSVTPVMMVRRNSNTSLQRSPPKHEIRQTVEAFCWKELKKLKEKEDHQMQVLISSCGYAEDPIRRSRSMAATPRDTRRSTSLPREVRQRRVDDIELNARRMAQQQRYNAGLQRGGDGQTRPIFNRGSLTQQHAIEQPIYSKKVSFGSQNPHNPAAWPTKSGFTQSPPQRRLEGDGSANGSGSKERESLEDDVFLPATPKEPQEALPSRDEIFLLNQQRQKELLLAKAQKSVAPVSSADNGSVISEVPPMRTIREPIYGTRSVINENPYGTRVPINDCVPRVVNEPVYGTRNGVMPRINESPYGTRNPSPNGYNIQNVIRNESPYGSRQFQNESPYGTRPGPPNRSMNESLYGSHGYTNAIPTREEPIYGSKPPNMMSPEGIYGSRASVAREPIYGSRQMHPLRMDSPYGPRLNPNGQRFLPGYPPPGHQEPVYGTRPTPHNVEAVYGYRMSNGSVRSESPFAGRPPLPMGPNQQVYNRPRLGPPLPSGGPGRTNIPPGLKRSNSLRQHESPEALYAVRPNFNKPPSGVQYRQRGNMPQMDLSPPGQRHPEPPQGRYDFPPPDSPPRKGPQMQQQQMLPEPIYGGRKINVNNKVCDMYGNIYDANKPEQSGQVPMSPPPFQKAGVLYGQLQRNSNAPPMVYQSHQLLQPNNFQRGTRLTASVNDVHRYNSGVAQRTEPPSRPLPPIPDEQKKSRFGFGRKKSDAGKGK